MTKSPSGFADIKLYLDDVRRFPISSKKDQIALAKKAQAGDTGARDRLFQSNLRLVISVAKKYSHLGFELNDLIQHGNFGLIHALELYNPETGNAFTTYAIFWIRQNITRAITSSDQIRRPCHLYENIRRLRRVREKLTQELVREATPEEIAERIGTSPERVRGLINIDQGVTSLDIEIGEDGGATIKDLLADTESLSLEDSAGNTSLKNAVLPLLDILNDRDKGIMMLRFGLNGLGGKVHTLAEIAGLYNISRQRVQQIVKLALKKLRRLLRRQRKELSDFV